MCRENTAQEFTCRSLSVRFQLHQNDGAGNLIIDVQLSCAVVNVHKKEVVQEKILEEIIPVILLTVSDHQILYLADSNSCDHQRVISISDGSQDICSVFFVADFQQIMIADNLTVHGGFRKSGNDIRSRNLRSLRHGKQTAVHVLHAELHLRNGGELLQATLNNL